MGYPDVKKYLYSAPGLHLPPESPPLPKRLNFIGYFVDGSTKKELFYLPRVGLVANPRSKKAIEICFFGYLF